MNKYKIFALIITVIIHLVFFAGLFIVKLNGIDTLSNTLFFIEFEKDDLSLKENLKAQDINENEEIVSQANEEVKEMLSKIKTQQIENISEINNINKTKEPVKFEKKSLEMHLSSLKNGKLVLENNAEIDYVTTTEQNIFNEIINTKLGRVIIRIEDRYKLSLEIPVFTCEFGGEVVVEITVNRNGKVVNTKILNKNSLSDDCLLKAARYSAINTTFNSDLSAPKFQKGTIQYFFESQ